MKLLLVGRCPPTVGPNPRPSPPLVPTPAWSNERFNTPAPETTLGRSDACLLLYEDSTCAVVVSISIAAAVTSTALETSPTFKTMLAVAAKLTRIATSLTVDDANPLAEAVRSYDPGGRL